MSEPSIKSNEREAARLYERGVAAARSGQRRVAAGLLSRAVQLNPRHELAWLWLSGVLDKPDEIAFCLRSVLTVNPHNERARQGLIWLEQQGKIAAQPIPPPLPAVEQAQRETIDEDYSTHAERESWWVRWRRERREMSRARLVFWMVPILLLTLTLGLNFALRDALARNTAMVEEAAKPPTPLPTSQAVPEELQPTLADNGEAQAMSYISSLEDPRAQLRDAVERYRNATSQPGGSSVAHAAAARNLRDTIDAAYTTFSAIEPPEALLQAHNHYLAGLDLERQALNDMLEFYNSFSVQYANRATLRMIDAERQFEQARTQFEARRRSAADALFPVSSVR